MSDDAPASGVLRRYRTYDSPPRDFDLRTATARALREHGVPPRPDPRLQPALDRIWKQAAARDLTYVKAELAVDSASSSRDPRLRTEAFDEDGQSNWAGVYVSVTGARFVFAEWVVPDVPDVDPALFRPITAGFWVGIDGVVVLPGGTQLLQAGIRVDVTPHWPFLGGGVRWQAFTEWWSLKYAETPQAGAATVDNFPVSSGDTVSFLIYTEQPNLGYVWISNLSTGQQTLICVPAAPQIASFGGTVEWIIEAPRSSDDLPAFSPVTFTSCVGGSAFFGSTYAGRNPIMFDIDGRDGKLTRTSIPSETSVMVEWLGWS
jgi:hypothetical protein